MGFACGPPLVTGRVDWSLLSAPWDAHPSPLHREGLGELWGLGRWDTLAGKEVLGSVP